ncbi:ABC transporter [Rathayibacter sp. VKM Ac-2760]|uniref:ABC transporter n=1 Tax=Rathayibacter sp. VKM Ac-2760 TaxID=2609253 RepID=UPI0013189867|nr:ABC transporter [Rathayibacter sp. VKM Ac-2760]QHC60227.1 ABC transporter [Rathayibacter sp. VKM Ac-2760]
MRTRTLTLPLLASGALLALAACSSPGAPAASDAAASDAAAPPAGDAYGWTEGAAEMQEAQLRLVALGADGALTALDPATEETVPLASLPGSTAIGTTALSTTALSTDGRYVFAAQDGALTIVDGGAWTVPHGDHSHYYLAEPRTIGTIDGGGGLAVVHSSASLTAAFFPGSGTGVVLDGEALADGELRELARVEGSPHDGALVPLGDRLIGSTATGSVAVLASDGEATGTTAACAGTSGAAVTRVGVVFGCADGAVLATETEPATESDAGVAFEHIPYPEGTAAEDVATAFSGRPGRPAVAAVAGEQGAWLLDTRARSWTLLPSPEPLLAASAVSDSDGTVVGIDRGGRVVVLKPDGVATTEPLLDVADGRLPDGVTLEVDVARAYVNAPSAGLVHEIDYDDDARVARSLALDARLLVETGR